MADFEIPEEPGYEEKIRKFEPQDHAHAELFNKVVQSLVNNDTFIKKLAEQLAETLKGHIEDKYNPHGITPDKLGLHRVAVSGSYSDLADRPASLPADGGNADTAKKLEYFANTSTTDVGLDAAQNAIGHVDGTSSVFGEIDGALYQQAFSDLWKAQIYQDYRSGQIAFRGKNVGTWQPWRKAIDSINYKNYLTDFYQQRDVQYTGNIDTLYNKKNTGSYWIHPNAAGTKPTTNYFDLLVFSAADEAAVQIAIPYKGDNVKTDMYMRSRVEKKWSVWRNLSDGGDADTVDGVRFHPTDMSGAPNGFGFVYGFAAGGDNNAYVFPTSQMAVNSSINDGDGNNIADTYAKKSDVPKIQCGTNTVKVSRSNAWNGEDVIFPKSFTSVPKVVACVQRTLGNGESICVTTRDVTESGFGLSVWTENAAASVQISVNWIAVGE